jgi:hypothetical protein
LNIFNKFQPNTILQKHIYQKDLSWFMKIFSIITITIIVGMNSRPQWSHNLGIKYECTLALCTKNWHWIKPGPLDYQIQKAKKEKEREQGGTKQVDVTSKSCMHPLPVPGIYDISHSMPSAWTYIAQCFSDKWDPQKYTAIFPSCQEVDTL